MPADHLEAAEEFAFERHVNPIPVVEVQYGAGRDGCAGDRFLTVERSTDKHPEPQDLLRIGDLEPHFRRSKVRIEDRTDIADPSLEKHVRISVDMDIGVFANAHETELILVNVADDPHVGKVGYGHEIWR